MKKKFKRAIINFAAETHVDRSIVNPEEFLQTNITGIFRRLLDFSKSFWENLDEEKKSNFRFVHISTDEVFGKNLKKDEKPFDEKIYYQPNSPYSASKSSFRSSCKILLSYL